MSSLADHLAETCDIAAIHPTGAWSFHAEIDGDGVVTAVEFKALDGHLQLGTGISLEAGSTVRIHDPQEPEPDGDWAPGPWGAAGELFEEPIDGD